ncbi:hypothetical protein VHEMI07957 [[Torrubiella] hemipterigena]|uniref:Mid2 domain-containing protein n=1 Tax=[Torrubiella] hemipterigena TaxID=1531966 RepID=A0A0A1TNV1_9HYPO|nr:hypothetical protein VHEMI07957 [[Torrubiella] hemipterigena]
MLPFSGIQDAKASILMTLLCILDAAAMAQARIPSRTMAAEADLVLVDYPFAPTPAPQLPEELRRRQLNTICGYIGGDPKLPATCSAGSHCVAEMNRNVIGCCPDAGPCSTGVFTACVDRNNPTNGAPNPLVFTCSGSNVCYKNSFAGGFTQFGCGSASNLATSVATAASGQPAVVFGSVSGLAAPSNTAASSTASGASSASSSSGGSSSASASGPSQTQPSAISTGNAASSAASSGASTQTSASSASGSNSKSDSSSKTSGASSNSASNTASSTGSKASSSAGSGASSSASSSSSSGSGSSSSSASGPTSTTNSNPATTTSPSATLPSMSIIVTQISENIPASAGTTSSRTSATGNAASQALENEGEPKTNMAAIIGGVLGGISGIVLIVAAILFFRRRQMNKDNERRSPSAQGSLISRPYMTDGANGSGFTGDDVYGTALSGNHRPAPAPPMAAAQGADRWPLAAANARPSSSVYEPGGYSRTGSNMYGNRGPDFSPAPVTREVFSQTGPGPIMETPPIPRRSGNNPLWQQNRYDYGYSARP